MRYRVKVIEETDLPAAHDWALVIRDDVAVVFVKRSALRAGLIGPLIADYEAGVPRRLSIVA